MSGSASPRAPRQAPTHGRRVQAVRRPCPPPIEWRLGAVLAVALATSIGAQQTEVPQGQAPPDLPPVEFRTDVTFVEVDVFVTGSAGQPVTGLAVEDFELFEDGARQEIQSFSAVNLPVERRERPLFAARPIEPDVRTNAGADGRVYLILLDDITVHPSRVPRARAALRQFIERDFGTNDLAAVVRVRGGSQDSQDFTNDPQRLLRAVDRFTGSLPRDGRPAGAPSLAQPQGPPGEPGREVLVVEPMTIDDHEMAHDARNVASRLRELSEFLAGVRGRRKSLIFVSEGSPFDVNAASGQMAGIASVVIEDTRKAIDAARRGNVTIYAIDPRGLMPMDTNDLSAFDPPGGFEAPEGLAALGATRLSQDSLRELAAETGGFSSINQSRLDGTFERIVRENSAYYLLGYSPSNDTRDGRYRRVQVRVNRPGLTLRFRNGYAAASGPPPLPGSSSAARSEVVAALTSPFPTSGIPMTVFAAPFRGSGRTAAVAVAIEMDASKLFFIERNGLYTERVEVLHSATDGRGQRHAPLRHELALNLKPDTYGRVLRSGLRVLTQIELQPGRYQLRVAAGSATSGQAGGVLYDLDVPDFTSRDLTMSGLVLTSSRAADAVTIAHPQVSPIFRAPAITARDLDGDDTLEVFGEVYENLRGGPAHTVEIATTLQTDAGRVVRRSVETRSSTELREGGGGYGFSATVPLSGLDPGIYVIHAEARSNVGSRPTVSRDIQIRVR